MKLKEDIKFILDKYDGIEWFYNFNQEKAEDALKNLASTDNIAKEIAELFEAKLKEELIKYAEDYDKLHYKQPTVLLFINDYLKQREK